MRSFTKNSTLYDFAPELLKEWHPSANGPLTPRNVKIDYSKKVWWICSEGHEWQATVKTRIKGSTCPNCVRHPKKTKPRVTEKVSDSKNDIGTEHAGLKTYSANFESDAPDDNFGHDFRKTRRYMTRATAVLENRISGHWFYTDVKNVSTGGMCFESAAPVKPGTQIIIKLDRPLLTLNRKTFNCIVRWCRTVEDEDKTFSGYTIGAKYI